MFLGNPTTENAVKNSGGGFIPRGYISGLLLGVAAIDEDHDINVGPGKCRDYADSEDMVRASAITKQCDANWAVGSAAGGLLSGSLDASSVYGIWLIKRTDTGVVDVGVEKNKVSPDDTITLPTNYDKQRFIGGFFTDGSANIKKFYHRSGGLILFETPSTDVVDSTITSGSPEVGTMRVLPDCIGLFMTYFSNDNNDAGAITLRYPLQTGIDVSFEYSSFALEVIASADGIISGVGREICAVNGSRQLEYIGYEKAGSGELTARINTYGYFMTTRERPYYE